MENNTKFMITLLKAIADQKGITNYQMSQGTGIGQTNLALYFNHATMPSLEKFLKIATFLEVNFYFEARDSKTDINKAMERAMSDLGRRPDNLPMN